jgi:hypothetical protein
MPFECPYCTKPLPAEPALCCGEFGHATARYHQGGRNDTEAQLLLCREQVKNPMEDWGTERQKDRFAMFFCAVILGVLIAAVVDLASMLLALHLH